MESIITNINQISSDFRSIKDKVIEKGVDIPDGTPTYEYANKISEVYEAGYVQGAADNTPSIDPNWTEGWRYMFSSDARIKQMLPKLKFTDTSNATSFFCMFYNGYALVEPPLFDVRKTNNTQKMFYGCYNLERIPQYDFTGAYEGIYAGEMFSGCSKLTYVPDLNAKFGVMQNMFYNCSSLEVAPTLDFSKCTDTKSMFSGCSKLKTIPKFKAVYMNSSTFYNCKELTYVGIEGEITSSFDIKYSPLTNECAKNILKALKNHTGTSLANRYTVTFLSTVKEALIAEGATAPGDLTWEEYVISKAWSW